jgi:hypothetical protein
MPTYHGTSYGPGGPDMLRTRAATAGRIQVWLLPSYTAGASYATLNAAKAAAASLVAGDIVTTGASGASTATVIAAKSTTLTATVAAASLSTLHQAIVDTVSSEVHLVGPVATPTNTTTGSAATGDLLSGSAYTTAAMTYTLPQPAAA